MSTSVIEDLLKRGTADYLDLTEVMWVVRSVKGLEHLVEVRRASLEVLEELLEAGLMEAGDLTDGGFFQWDLTPTAAIERIRREWPPNTDLEIGQICWLLNTPEGDRRAHGFG